MADTTPAKAPDPATAGNSWGNMLPFIKMAFGGTQQPQTDFTKQQGDAHPAQHKPPAATPTNMAGMGAGPFVQQGVVQGPMMAQAPESSSPAVPMGYSGLQMPVMPTLNNPNATSPMVGLPSLKTSAPLTADHFSTGTPNPFGNR